ncbi:nuclease-related domain-containing protein [Macrococcus carouselicus]|uniref:NERD domain-containing protein n=1 Tax=Macrococcus carouselicus TaxID=69969 RepID=A0A9Q8CPZ8_9STAP|nr:nuclease-related domain-containing protein [Macrococcus carouselicus]TDM04425.1 NERD domain-containing protein [Macrococcus carouselicus]
MNRKLMELELLNARGGTVDMKQLDKERKGDVGEKQVQKMLEGYEVIRDILLEVGGSYLQLDFLVVCRDRMVILEVKHHQHDYEIIKGQWHFMDGKSCSSPVQQLERSKSLVNKWLKKRNIFIRIEGYIVWTNPNSQIYGLQKSDQVIRPGKLGTIINQFDSHYKNPYLKQLFLDGQIIDSPFYSPQNSSSESIRAMHCPYCFQTSLEGKRKRMYCTRCSQVIELKEIIHYQILFYCALNQTSTFRVFHIEQFIGNRISRRTLLTYFKNLLSDQKIIQTNCWTYQLNEPIHLIINKLEIKSANFQVITEVGK